MAPLPFCSIAESCFESQLRWGDIFAYLLLRAWDGMCEDGHRLATVATLARAWMKSAWPTFSKASSESCSWLSNKCVLVASAFHYTAHRKLPSGAGKGAQIRYERAGLAHPLLAALQDNAEQFSGGTTAAANVVASRSGRPDSLSRSGNMPLTLHKPPANKQVVSGMPD